jgi:nucleotide-binding universal stress UspA family protein
MLFSTRAWLRRPQAGQGLEEHLAQIEGFGHGGARPLVRAVAHRNVAAAVIEEAAKGFDMILLGASADRDRIGGKVIEDIVESAPCHVAIVRAGPGGSGYKRVLVPIDGTATSRIAAEFAVRYAEVAGAELTLAILTEHRPQADAYADTSIVTPRPAPAVGSREELERISSVFRASPVAPTILHLDYDPSQSALSHEVERGHYDLIALGAENRAIQHRLFLGYENERIVRSARTAVAIIVPKIAQLS